jgi:hypothetical protein
VRELYRPRALDSDLARCTVGGFTGEALATADRTGSELTISQSGVDRIARSSV